MIYKEKSGSCKDWNTKIIRVFSNSYVYWIKFKSSCGCCIFIQYNLPCLGGSDTPQRKKATPALILTLTIVLVQNISFKLHLYCKILENFQHPSQYVQISPEKKKKPCRKRTVKPFGSCNQTAGGNEGEYSREHSKIHL